MQIAVSQPVASDSGHIQDVTTQSFAKDVIEASKQQPVIVDFWAPWCGPCKQLTPVIEKLVNAAGGKVKLAKMNIDEHPAIAGQLGVQSLPTVIAFKNGQPIDAFMGALPESQVKQFIDTLGGSASGAPDVTALLKSANEALGKGDSAGALQVFADVLTIEPKNLSALGGMAQAYVKANEIDQAKNILANVPQDAAEPAIVSARSAIALHEKSDQLGDIPVLQKKVESDPQNYQARFDLALGLAGHDRRQEAVDELVYIMTHKRDWNDDAARQQLLQFFEAWGFDDEAAIYGRKKLSSLLFA